MYIDKRIIFSYNSILKSQATKMKINRHRKSYDFQIDGEFDFKFKTNK